MGRIGFIRTSPFTGEKLVKMVTLVIQIRDASDEHYNDDDDNYDNDDKNDENVDDNDNLAAQR